MYIPPKHSAQLLQTEKGLMISSTFTTISNLSNTIITAAVNAHLSLWHSSTEDHRGELIEDILLNLTTASADLHNCTSWQTIHSLAPDHFTHYPQYT